MNRHPGVVSLGIVSTFSFALSAYAQMPTGRLDAEALASAGGALAEKGDWVQACAKYEGSARLDPSARRFMKFAECQERAGKLAAAWISFGEAQDRAQAQGDKVLAGAARESVKRLDAKLARIEIVVPPESAVEGLQIRRDGVVVADAVRGIPVPVDPGSHIIAATAPGRRPWSTTIGLGAGKAVVSVVIPLLEDASSAAAPSKALSREVVTPGDDLPLPAAPSKALSRDEMTPGDDLPLPANRGAPALRDRGPFTPSASSMDEELDPQRGSTQRTVGWVLGGVGLTSVALGTAFALRVAATNDNINDACSASACMAYARDRLDTLREQALLANVFIWGGIASLAGGALVYFTAPSPQGTERSTASIRIAPSVAPGGGVLWATGRF